MDIEVRRKKKNKDGEIDIFTQRIDEDTVSCLYDSKEEVLLFFNSGRYIVTDHSLSELESMLGFK
jgi:hypothetical protein